MSMCHVVLTGCQQSELTIWEVLRPVANHEVVLAHKAKVGPQSVHQTRAQ